MNHGLLLTTLLILSISMLGNAQNKSERLDNVSVSATTAKFLGKSKEIRALVAKSPTPKVKKNASRRLKKAPANFKGRRSGGKSVHAHLEHQGPDPIRQTEFVTGMGTSSISPIVNIQGLGNLGSPHDPTGDVSDEYYVQAINVTTVGVYDLQGNLVQSFAMNTLWAEFNASSEGDPIVLYDENAEKWYVTEFTDPANLLIAVSETKDPLGSYNAYSFSTPEFPDYPKYAITPTALVVTTNEEDGATLHQYFLDIQALNAGADNVRMIRVAVQGNPETEAGFYVTTPADWNGQRLPFDNRPITLAINDSSWPGGPAQDQIEIYSFNLNFDMPDSTTVDRTPVVTTPFDSYPCSTTAGGEFACLPQLNGGGLDAIPEVIMNIPHLRNFGTHESLVFNFVTDFTNGQNQSGIRWVELRRTVNTDWELYQEGTFAPDDGLDRFMGSIAIDENGDIGMAYNVTSADTYVGIRFTGRYASDALGQMTVEEVNVIDGASVIESGGRFGDYSQLSVSPKGDNTFWFTSEYATDNDAGTRIVAFQLTRDSFDLNANAILEPVTSDILGTDELVTAQFTNLGLNPMAGFSIGLLVGDQLVETQMISDTLAPDSSASYQFSETIDLSLVGSYEIGVFISHPDDQNRFNDTLRTTILQLVSLDASVQSEVESSGCDTSASSVVRLTNLGFNEINTADIEVLVNGTAIDTINFIGAIAYSFSANIDYEIAENLVEGNNLIAFQIININGNPDPNDSNNSSRGNYEQLSSDNFITLIFSLDEFPEETIWTLTDTIGNLIASGNFPFTAAETRVEQRVCVPYGACYILRVTDSEGDGICCDYGTGYFSVLDNEGNELVNNDGDFGSVAEELFCLNGECLLTAEVVVENATGSNVADGSILINVSSGVGPYRYSIDGGATTQSSPLFENLLPGDYEVFVAGASDNCSYTESVVVSFSTGLYQIDGQLVRVEIMPNPTNGVFKLVISNLEINDPLLDVEILDLNGRIVQGRTIGKYDNDYTGTLSLFDFPGGHYFLRILHPEVRILERIVKLD